MTALKLHRLNAVFLGIFIILHFATHLSGVAGIETYNAVQKALRIIYRNPVVEPVLLLSVALQAYWGLRLLIKKVRKRKLDKWGRVQVISGGLFLFFLTEHLVALVLARWIDGLDTNFYWPASVMSGSPFTWYFVPYYFLGVASLFTHLGCAIRIVLLRKGHQQHAAFGFWATTLPGAAIGVLINLILLGAFFEIHLPGEWLEYLRRFVAGYSPQG